MKYTFAILMLFIVLVGCSNQSQLSKDFSCSNLNNEDKSPKYNFHRNFKLMIPKFWKTELYYNKFQSEVFCADTVKQLTKTYILDASHNSGIIQFNEDYFSTNDSIVASNNLQITKSKTTLFQEKPCYWYVSEGVKKGFVYHQFNLTVLLSENTYFNTFVEIYGEDDVDERICNAISIIESVEFLQ